jgi:hypothetical protein
MRRQHRLLAFTSDTINKIEVRILFQCCLNTAHTNKPITPIDFGKPIFLLTELMRFVMQLEFISNNGHARITLGRVRQQVRRKVFIQYRHSPRYARIPHAVMPVLTRESLSAGDGESVVKRGLK